jgi:hypothetical protein
MAAPQQLQEADAVIYVHGDTYELTLVSPAAAAWVKQHVGSESHQQLSPSTLGIQRRYIDNIVNGMRTDGLRLRWQFSES